MIMRTPTRPADPTKPRQLARPAGTFDRIAARAAVECSSPRFFTLSIASVLAWAASLLVLGDGQLIIGAYTGIVTFLLVALLQNTQRRSELALHAKLNVIAANLVGLARAQEADDRVVEELEESIGLEHHA